MWRTERQPREVNCERHHDAGENTDLPRHHSQAMPTRARLQRSAPPRRHRKYSARYERQPTEPQHHHERQPTHHWCQVHASRRPQHLRTPHQPPPTAPPHPPLPPSAAPVLARSAPPPDDPCRCAAPAPNAPAATSPGGQQGAGPSWLPPWGMRPSSGLSLVSTSGVSASLPAGCSTIERGTRAATAPLRLMPTLSPFRPTACISSPLLNRARPIVATVSARLPHHSRRLRHQRTASQAAALTASSPTSQGQLLCTMATIHLSPIAIRSRPTPHRSRLPGKERLESLIITISSQTANWVLVSPRPTHRVTSLPLASAVSFLASPQDAPATVACAGSVRSVTVAVVSASAFCAHSLYRGTAKPEMRISESTWSPHTAQGWFDSGRLRANSSRYGPGLTRSIMANCSAGLRECSVTGALNQVG